MLDKRNRKYANDSYQIAVMRAIFMMWMKKRGQWVHYKFGLVNHKAQYIDAWEYPCTPKDFLGNASILFNTFLEWEEFLDAIDGYFNTHLLMIYKDYEIKKMIGHKC
jgi:hypothetical protein